MASVVFKFLWFVNLYSLHHLGYVLTIMIWTLLNVKVSYHKLLYIFFDFFLFTYNKNLLSKKN